jgi:hypothetical protein
MTSSIIKKSVSMPQLLNDEQYNQEVDTDVATAQ